MSEDTKRGNKHSYIEEQTTQLPKEKGQSNNTFHRKLMIE